MTDPTGVAGVADLSDRQQRVLDNLAANDGRAFTEFPASYAQRRQWFLHQLAPASSSYAMPIALRLRGPLDASSLSLAVASVAGRHESLRTTFSTVDGQPRQRVHLTSAVTVQWRHAPSATAAEVEARAAAATPFDLETGPLVRVIVWRLATDDHVLLVVAHHIIADGWSVDLLLRDLAADYDSYHAGSARHPAPPSIQPADYAVWEATELTLGRLRDSVEYWRAQLDPPPPPLELPADRAHPADVAGPAGTVRSTVDAGLAAAVAAFARRVRATDFVVLLSAFAVALGRFTGQSDLVVGSPMSGRLRREMAELVGCFVNTVPLRLRWNSDATVAELTEHVRVQATDAQRHQVVPLDLLVGQLVSTRDSAATPLFSVAFTVQDESQLAAAFAGLSVVRIELDPAQAKFDLTCVIGRSGSELVVQWDYRADLLDQATVAALAGAFGRALATMSADPGQSLATLDLGPVTLLADPPVASATGPTLATLFDVQVAAVPDKVAIWDGGTALTYRELDRRANRLAHALRASGVGPETGVGLCLPRSADFAVACLAVVKAGGFYVPLDPAYPVDRLGFLIDDSQVRLVITRRGLADWLSGPQVVYLDDDAAGAAWPDSAPPVATKLDTLCLLVSTSGSTGRPKPVGITHRGVVDLALPGGYCGFSRTATVLWISSVSFDAATWEIWGTLLHGATAVICAERAHTARDLQQTITDHAVTVALFTPALFNAVVDEDVTALRGLRWLLVGGEALSPTHIWQAQQALPELQLVNAYGPAEITTIASCHPVEPTHDPMWTVPIGTPVAGTTMTAVDGQRRPVPPGAVGELWLTGSGLARGYVGHPALTAERFVPAPGGRRWYRTGDLARQLGTGGFVFRGRVDQQVKVRGHRVEPDEVRAVLEEQPSVRRAVVVPKTVGPADCRLVAYVVPSGTGDVGSLREDLRRWLPDYLMPAQFVVIDQVPVTVNGKVDVAALAALDRSGPGRRALGVPRSEAEDALADVWSGVLGLDATAIGPDDDFFVLGGHSVLAMMLVARLREHLGIDLPLAHVFERPTLSGQAGEIARLRAVGSAGPARYPRVPRPARLSESQQRVWFLSLMDPESSTYNIPLVARVRGPLDHAALDRAIRWLAQRHEVLRSVVVETDDGDVPHTRPATDLPALSTVDISAAPDPVPALAAVLDRTIGSVFDLARDIPLRYVLVRQGPDDHVVCLVIHHIAADGWSVGIIADELSRAYLAFRHGSAPVAIELEAQFVDVADARRLSGAELATGVDFWRGALAGASQLLGLPAPSSPSTSSGPSGAVLPFELAEADALAVRALGSAAGCTDFVVLLSAFAAVVSAHSGQSEFLVGTPVANRPDRTAERLVGFFANTVVLRLDTGGDPTVGQLLERVRQTTVAALSHQDVPFERLVDALASTRDPDRNPLFQIMFSYDSTPPPRLDLPGLDVEPMVMANPSARCDLTLALTERGGRVEGLCEFGTERFAPADVLGLLDQLTRIVRAFTADPGRRLSELAPPAADNLVAEDLVRDDLGPDDLVPDDLVPDDLVPDDLVATVATVWANVLGGAERIDPDADFFSIGGHSFLAARVASRLGRELGLKLGPRAIFEHPTVAGLAGWLRTQTRGPAADGIARLDPGVTRGPLSYAQEHLWFLAQIAPESAAYNIPLVARLEGPVDVGALQAALSFVVGRHESLRTRYGNRDGLAGQRVIDIADAAITLAETDLTAPAAARDLVTSEAFRPFDIVGGELPLRAQLVRVGPAEHLIAVTVHHLAADGWSVQVLLGDLSAAYAVYREGRAPQLPPLPLRYLDYATWQRARDGALADGLSFWRGALQGAPQVLELPTIGARPTVRRYRGASLDFGLGAELTTGLAGLARDTGCTEFMVLLAGLATVLSRYSGQRDLLIGAPVANRADPATESLVGLLANIVVLRADLRGDPTVRELLARIRTVSLDAFNHQEVPFERVVEDLAPARDQSRSPLFQVMLALNNAPAPAFGLPGIVCSALEPANPTAKFDLVLNLAEQTGPQGQIDVRGFCEFDVDLYDPTMMAGLLRNLRAVLATFAADPDRRLSELRLADDERVDVASEAGYDYRTCLHTLVEAAVDATPDAVAVVAAGGAHLTYRDLDVVANRLAHQLIAAAVGPDEVVAVCVERSLELVVAEYAVLKAGAAILPVDPDWPARRLAEVLDDAGCRVVLTGPGDRTSLPAGIRMLPVALDPVIGTELAGANHRPAVATGPGHRAYVIYTSGSTGRPKGAEVEHAAICNNLLWMQQDWPLDGRDSMLHKTAPTFDVAVKEVFWPLLAGARLVLAEPGTQADPLSLVDQLATNAITVTHFVPSMLDLVLTVAEARGTKLGTALRYVMCGAETLAVSTQRRFFDLCDATLLHMYGPTETAIAVTGWTCDHDDPVAERVPLGRPMPNCSLHVLDADLNPVPSLVWGELHVGGVPLGRGYLRRPAATASAFVPDPFSSRPGARLYRTGDVVRHGPQGLLEFRGRVDNQVKIRGIRVDLGEVEAALRTHPAVGQAAVVVAGAVQSDAHLVGFVVGVAGQAAPGSPELRQFVRDRLPGHQVPAMVVGLDRLPLNANGKVDRAVLAQTSRSARPADEDDFVAPRDPLEQAVAEVWSEVLGLSQVGVETDFFALGGHSLQAARIVALLRERFGWEVPLRDLFAEPTVATVARLVRDRTDRDATRQDPTHRDLRVHGGADELPRITRRRVKPATMGGDA